MPFIIGQGPVQQKILRCLRDNGPLTIVEVAEKSGQQHDTAATTVRRMGVRGLIHDTGQRSGATGRAVVWEIAAKGMRAIQRCDAQSVEGRQLQ